MVTLRVLSLNLWGTNGPVDDRMTRLHLWLRQTPFDVIGLQEVQRWAGKTQAHAVAEAAGLGHVHYTRSGRGMLSRGEGLAVVTAMESEPVATVDLPHGDDAHRRAVQLVDAVVAGGHTVRVANTHLAYKIDASDLRRAQAAKIRDELRGWDGLVVLTGDLNDAPGSPALHMLTEKSAGWRPLVDTYAAAGGEPDRITFDLDNPFMGYPELAGRRVDHVLSRGLQVVSAEVVLDGTKGPLVSDHYGVAATLRLP